MKSILLLALLFAPVSCYAGAPQIVTNGGAGFPLVGDGTPAAVVVDPTSPPGLKTVAGWFADDLMRLSGRRPQVSERIDRATSPCVIVGVVNAGGLIDALVAGGKLDVSEIASQPEASVTATVDSPCEGVESALVVAGSDQRGAIYGLFDLSQAAGVSPWYWWADVPVTRQENLRFVESPHVRSAPLVRYRGIFLNDEAPALANWAQQKFGGCNSKFYVHVYELLLRLRGNFLWPAMWGRSLFDDDPESQRLADELGIVLSTSHHEPMQRAHVEWARYGKGPWDYSKNAETLQEFWREGIRRMGDKQSVVTLGMRGDGDEPMTEEANIDLLQKIVSDQRQILTQELGQDITTQPQVWALYKEVQEYYDRGMRVPDDVILLLCDDNWGDIRRLPHPDDAKHPGGYGIYYHFDYVGGPRNYKWLNTNNLPRVWEQMNLAWQHGVDQIWVVNVGDLKPIEQPIDFFLSMAWNPQAMPPETIHETLHQWQVAWAAEQFGAEHAEAIAELLVQYGRYVSRRTPELLSPETYCLDHWREWERVIAEWRELASAAEGVRAQLAAEYHPAYYQLVEYPIVAMANLHELYFVVAKNRQGASQRRAGTNALADRAEELFARDKELSDSYHRLLDGKWNHMMSQTHIGYTSWQEPRQQIMPEVQRLEQIPAQSSMEIAIRGVGAEELPQLVEGGAPGYVDLYNRGRESLEFTTKASDPWIVVTPRQGQLTDEVQLQIGADWSRVPAGQGRYEGSVAITGTDGTVRNVQVAAMRPASDAVGYLLANGYAAIPAAGYTTANNGANAKWLRLPDVGRCGVAMTTMPTTAPSTPANDDGVYLEYLLHVPTAETVKGEAWLSPTLDFYGKDDHGIRFALAIDAGQPVTIDMHADGSTPEKNSWAWGNRVAANVHIATSPPMELAAGNHRLRFYRVDSGAVLQKLVLRTDAVPDCYLGPPTSPLAKGPTSDTGN